MTDVFKFLTYLITNHGYWATVTFVGLSVVPLIAAVYIVFSKSSLGKVIDKKFSEKLEGEKATHKEGNRLRKQFSKDVHEILQDLAEHTATDRALVFEYSNGTSNVVGLPFLFMSAAAEVVTPNTQPVGANYQKVNVAIASKFLLQLEEEGYIYIPDLDATRNEFPILSYLMAPNNVKSAFFYSLQGVDETIGFLVITTIKSSDKIINVHLAMPLMARAAQKVSTLLNFSELTKKSDELKNKNKWNWLW